MAFEIVSPSRRPLTIKSGVASINKARQLSVSNVDLIRAGIRGNVAVLVDVSTKRIAIRSAKDHEPSSVIRLNKGKTSGSIGISAAMTRLGVDHKGAKGRYELHAKDDLLYIVLQ